jgi:hypothetical protein
LPRVLWSFELAPEADPRGSGKSSFIRGSAGQGWRDVDKAPSAHCRRAICADERSSYVYAKPRILAALRRGQEPVGVQTLGTGLALNDSMKALSVDLQGLERLN